MTLFKFEDTVFVTSIIAIFFEGIKMLLSDCIPCISIKF